jgi:hypothetical protein
MRHCGDCQLCCKLLPVRAVHKRGGVKCQHQKFGVGCAIYAKLEMISPECRLWNCAWLGNAAGDLARPDRSHIVVDVMPDFVTVGDNGQTLPAVQVWIDPKHRDSHRDPALRAYLERRGRDDGACAVIRFGEADGFVLFPPALTGGGWIEHTTAWCEKAHTFLEVVKAAAQRRAS